MADSLYSSIQKKKRMKGFAEMTIFIESCEGGSMFQGFPYEDLDVYVETASGVNENSWATYCPFGPEPASNSSSTSLLKVCLGDLFSVSWMEDAEGANLQETLHDQFLHTRQRTSVNETYSMGSHVTQ